MSTPEQPASNATKPSDEAVKAALRAQLAAQLAALSAAKDALDCVQQNFTCTRDGRFVTTQFCPKEVELIATALAQIRALGNI